jgi:hypothetical protein
VDNLAIYCKNFVHLLNSLDDNLEPEDVEIKARVRCLNHRPFIFTVTVRSDYVIKVAFRMIFDPKIYWFGQHIAINGKSHHILEISKFSANRVYL